MGVAVLDIKVSRHDATWWAARDRRAIGTFERRIAEACRAAREVDPDTITITLDREDAEAMADFFTDPSERFLLGRVALACRAALERER